MPGTAKPEINGLSLYSFFIDYIHSLFLLKVETNHPIKLLILKTKSKNQELVLEKVTISLLNILIILLISSCSSSYKQPETFSSKMNRFNPYTEKVNLIPSPPPLPQGLMFSRRPASIENKPKNKKKLKPSRHLYFLTLFEQYQKIKAYSSATLPKINTCPHFHTPLLKEGFK